MTDLPAGHSSGADGAAHVRHEGIVFQRRLLSAQNRLSDQITSFAGSMRFVYLHAAWFAVWIAINVGLLGSSLVFDAFPFGLLTMIVSLEAIFLSTFVMISQNREAARADVRSELDFETNVRSEIWSRVIAEKLDVDQHEVELRIAEAIQHAKDELAKAKSET